MKQTLPHLFVSQKVWALVEEVVSPTDLIVSFQGDLIRVKNESSTAFRVSQRVLLKVISLFPLGFQIVDAKSTEAKYYRKLDLSI